MSCAVLPFILPLAFWWSLAGLSEKQSEPLPPPDFSAAFADSGHYVVSIQRSTVREGKPTDTLAITLNSFGEPIAAFDLKFALESPYLDIVEVLPGEICDSCEWEYFKARQINTAEKENYPRTVWQAVGLAKLGPGKAKPRCYNFERPASLVKLVLAPGLYRRIPDTVAQVFFFWEDCTDNTIANMSGNVLAISAQVFDYYGNSAEKTNSTALFPNRTGAPNQCVDPAAQNKPRRLIEFHNGGIRFRHEQERK